MIHYRLLDASGAPVSDTIYRSIERARRARVCPVEIVAFRSRSEALALSSVRLRVSDYEGSPAPRVLSAQEVADFIAAHELAKSSFHPKYPPSHASARRALEKRFNARLFGFIGDASVDCVQMMNVSCKWARYSCPIWINGRPSNVKGLAKYS